MCRTHPRSTRLEALYFEKGLLMLAKDPALVHPRLIFRVPWSTSSDRTQEIFQHAGDNVQCSIFIVSSKDNVHVRQFVNDACVCQRSQDTVTPC